MLIAEPDLRSDGSIIDHGEQVFSKPSRSTESRKALRYNIIIHIHAVEDFSSASRQILPFAPSSDNSSFGGLPDTDSGDSGPRRHSFNTRFGMIDGSFRLTGAREEEVPGRGR